MDPRDDPGSVEPEIDLFESDDAFLLRAALPGVRPEDIHVEASSYQVFLSAAGTAPLFPPKGRQARILHRKGRASQAGRYAFTTPLPYEIDPDAVQARYQHGMLFVRLPKRQAAAHRRVPIPIEAVEAPMTAPSVPTVSAPAQSAPTPPEEWMHEGRPAAKLGLAYIPTGSEDHTTKAQSLSQQQAQPSRSPQTIGGTSAVTTGQTNPLEPPPPQPATQKT